MTTPLNGINTHPLTDAAREVLARIARAPLPVQEVNPGVRSRFDRHPVALVEIVDLPSPYKSHKGKAIPHYKITTAGMAEKK